MIKYKAVFYKYNIDFCKIEEIEVLKEKKSHLEIKYGDIEGYTIPKEHSDSNKHYKCFDSEEDAKEWLLEKMRDYIKRAEETYRKML